MGSFDHCPRCGKGSLVHGVCNICHYQPGKSGGENPNALPLGTVLNGQYRIEQVLGSGGFGITYRATDLSHGIRVAIKELFPADKVVRQPDRVTVQVVKGQEHVVAEMTDRFRNEAQLLMQMNGENNILRIYSMFACNHTSYYSMEFLDGCNLRSFLQQHGPVPWSFWGPIMRDLLLALSVLHRSNLIHRDISPDNLILTRDNKVHLIDFGSVRTYQGNRHFTVIMKHHFAPWEQYYSDGVQGPWTDIYSLSVTTYMMLSGKLPPKASDRMNNVPTVPLKQYCPSLPDGVARAIEKGMAVRIENRFQTAREYLQALFPQAGGGLQQPVHHQAQQPGLPVQRQTAGGSYWLIGCKGTCTGSQRRLEANREISMGRSRQNTVIFPENSPGISRVQCILFINPGGEVFIRDPGSSYGTFINNARIGTRWSRIQPGMMLRFGNEVFQLIYH